jgi:acyl carrier protein
MAIDDQRIQQDLTDVFHSIFEDEDLVVSRDLTADRVEGWDSLTHVRLLLTVERKFHIKLSAPEVARLKSVGDLVDIIKVKVEGKGNSS